MKKKNRTPTPHDAAFRQFLAQPEIARDFMLIHLPPELRAVCDLSTLKLESGSFIEDDLRHYVSDVLYSRRQSFCSRAGTANAAAAGGIDDHRRTA